MQYLYIILLYIILCAAERVPWGINTAHQTSNYAAAAAAVPHNLYCVCVINPIKTDFRCALRGLMVF
jgi:hypothetical protein